VRSGQLAAERDKRDYLIQPSAAGVIQPLPSALNWTAGAIHAVPVPLAQVADGGSDTACSPVERGPFFAIDISIKNSPEGRMLGL
jgi:hypothetical protein